MTEPKNNMPVILGVIAALIVAGGAAFYFSNNMKKDAPVVTAQGETVDDTTPAATSSQNNGEPAITDEETAEAEKVAGTFDGQEVKKGNPVVARVDGNDITRVDVFRYIKMMPANVQQLPPQAVWPLAMEQVVNTRLVQNKAEDAGLENDPEVQQQLNLAKQQIARSVYVQRAVDKEISDSDLKAKYDDAIGKMPAVEEIKASHILVDSKEKAEDLIKQLEGGADFSKLAAENSGDPGNKNKGGDLGWFAKQDMVPEFSEAAFKLGKGEMAKAPVKTQFGWHVVRVDDKRQKPKPSFDEVKPMLQAELRREKLEGMLDKWKSAAKIETFDINGNPVKDQPQVAPAAGDAPKPEAAPEAAE